MGPQANHRRKDEDIVLSLAKEMLRSFGEFRFVALGSSMIPALFPGDTLIVRKETHHYSCVGDVLLFSRAGRFYAHRLVHKTEENGYLRLITRGDALDKNDPPFTESEMLGRVAAVIRRGRCIDLERHAGRRQLMIRWLVRRSDSAAKWVLRWNRLRGRVARNLVLGRGRRLARESV